MRYALLVALLILATGCTQELATGPHEVTGQLLLREAYCGKGEPTQEDLDRIKNPPPYPNQKIYVRQGPENDLTQEPLVAETTDGDGKFSLELEEGTYCLILEERLHPSLDPTDYAKNCNDTTVIAETQECVNKHWSGCTQVVNVKKDMRPVEVIYGPGCNPKAVCKTIDCLPYFT